MGFRRRSRTMFVTGCNGLLGRHLQRSPGMAAWELIAPGSRSLDVRHREQVLQMITEWKPDAVVHLAYNSHDRRTTFDGSRHVAEAAAACGARLVHLSSDIVFAGRSAPYVEHDPTGAVTEYGRMKADAELAVADACPAAVLVRTSLMYATEFLAPVQLDVQRALGGESRMAFFSDEFRCPAHAADVAEACVTLAGTRDIAGPLHVAGPDAFSRAELASAIARWLGNDATKLTTKTLAESGRLDRPARVVLDSSKAASLGVRCRPLTEALR